MSSQKSLLGEEWDVFSEFFREKLLRDIECAVWHPPQQSANETQSGFVDAIRGGGLYCALQADIY